MSSLADSILFDSVHQLLHLPEALERLTRGGGGGGGGEVSHRGNHGGSGGGARQQQEGDEIKGGWGSVPVDILETDKSYTFFLDVPGLSKNDVQVTLEDENVLVVKSSSSGGKRKRDEGEEEEEGCKYLRLERKASPKFQRKFRLPENANPSAITAKCENGVLTVAVEKLPSPREAKPKTVEVKIG